MTAMHAEGVEQVRYLLKAMHSGGKKTDSKTDAEAKQKSAPQTQKPQVLPNVFTSTARSNPAQPQTPVTSASSVSAQNSLKTRSDRLRAPDTVASVQRQLDPLASSDVVKRLTR